jgi:hypothetical protein
MSQSGGAAAATTARAVRLPLDALIPFVVAFGVVRVPGVDWLYAALGIALMVRARHLSRASAGLGIVYAVSAVCALVATLADGSSDAFVASYLWPVLAQALFALGVMAGADPALQVRRLIGGLLGGLMVLWVVGLAEIATGVKLVRVFTPSSKMAEFAAANRWVTSAVFANYNDYCLALSMLAALVFAHVLFVPRVHPFVALARWGVLGSSAALVAIMGSRGALAAGLLSAGVITVLAIRAVRPHLVTPSRLGVAAIIASPPAMWLWSSPYVQDHSTVIREEIIGNSVALWRLDPFTATVGYGSSATYTSVTEAIYPDKLMDPHNLFLEVAINFGLVALALAAWWWLDRLRHTITGRAEARTWAEAGSLALVAALPVMGVVSSRMLPYIYVTVLATAASLIRPVLRTEPANDVGTA